MDHDDFDFEPVRGIPAPLPEGERIVWQGAPGFRGLAINALHVRKVGIYFGVLMLARFAAAWGAGTAPGPAIGQALGLLPFALAAMGILAAIAWGYARSTVYTLTNRRLLIRSGIALQITLSLPLSRIASASLKLHRDGTGDLPIAAEPGERIAALAIWPHMRPWRWNRPEPMLRGIADAESVARRLAAALQEVQAGQRNAIRPATARALSDHAVPVAAHA